MILIVIIILLIVFYFLYSNREPFRTNIYGYHTPPNKFTKPFNILMANWHNLTKMINIDYSISYGTYLGWYRDKKYIPYDYDLDVHIGVEAVDVILGLKKYRWCFYPSELKYQPIIIGKTYLLINPFHNKPMNFRKRYNCRGKRVYKYMDSCSFDGIIARLIYYDGKKVSHIDIFVFHQENNPSLRKQNLKKKKAFSYKGPYAAYVTSDIGTSLPKTISTKINGVTTRCFNRIDGKKFLQTVYGKDFLIPDKIYLNNKWIAKKKIHNL